MKFKYDFGKPREAFEGLIEPVAKAGTAAIDLVGKDIKTEGRANIAGAGFGKRWQNALRVDRYPRRGVSANAALWIYHKIPYAEAFESGAVIHGTPLLWIPLSTAPKKIGRLKMTPRNYIASVGPLISINHPGKPPLLAAPYSGRVRSRTTLAGLRRGADKGGGLVPIFVGIKTITLTKRFALRSIFRSAAGRLSGYYSDQFKQEG